MIIEGKLIKADEGKYLQRISDGVIFGTELTLGYTHYINGVKCTPPIQEKATDYIDVTEIKVSDTESIYVTDLSYSLLKAAIVKLKYSYDGQIAIIINHQIEPNNDVYTKKYNDMQDWREKAGVIAKQYAKGGVNE